MRRDETRPRSGGRDRSFGGLIQTHATCRYTPSVLRAGHIVALAALALLSLGVVMVTSASMGVEPISPDGALSSSRPRGVWDVLAGAGIGRTLLYFVLAISAMWVAASLPVRRWLSTGIDEGCRGAERRALTILALGALCITGVLLLVYIPGLAPKINGARRWLRIPAPGLGQVSIQVSEIAKWGVVMLLAWYAAAQGPNLARFRLGLTPALIALAAICGIIVLEDLGTAALIACVGCLILWAGGAKITHFVTFAPAAIVGLAAAVWLSPYRVVRLIGFIDPYADPRGIGYHMIQSMRAVASGEGTGRGLGFGVQKYGYLPEDTTDFLFAVICEELGVAGAVMVVALYAALLIASLRILQREESRVGQLVCLGVMMTVGLQAMINLAVVTGIGPTKGIALPLVSAGGTGWILTAASLGLLIAMDRSHATHATGPMQDETPHPATAAAP